MKSHAKSHTLAVWYSHKDSNKGRKMNLPPLPEPDGFLCQRLYYKVGDVDEHCTQPHHNKWAEDQMREYGRIKGGCSLHDAEKPELCQKHLHRCPEPRTVDCCGVVDEHDIVECHRCGRQWTVPCNFDEDYS